eukprot:gi/632968942/ref/XP_007900812.1/ PREDICTED: synaptonemal complex protein 2-like isoform X3 [Callorhinchus milii]
MEEESHQASMKTTEDILVKKEFTLEFLIEDAVNVNGFQVLEGFLANESQCTPQKCNKTLLGKVDKLAHKEMDKNQFKNISLLMKCLQRFCKPESEESLNLLINAGLIQKIMLWFDRTTEFLKTTELKSNEALTTLVEDIFDIVLVICKCSSEGRTQLMDTFVLQLGHRVTDFRLKISLRLEAIRTFNLMLDSITRDGRKKFQVSELYTLMLDLAKAILEVGDYEIQVAISEALCRVTLAKERENLVHEWFVEDVIANAFKRINDAEFETDCRKFLNQVNTYLGNKRRVYTFPCNSAFLDQDELKMPADDKLEKFWIDFNLGSRSVTFFIKDENPDGATDLWETVSLHLGGVKSFLVQEINRIKIFNINMKAPLLISRKEGKKVKIYFDPEFDILNAAILVYGDEKLMDLVCSPELDIPDLHIVEIVIPETQSSTQEKSETIISASDGDVGRKPSSLQQLEEQRWHSDTEGKYSRLLKITSKLNPPLTTKVGNRMGQSSTPKVLLPVQNKNSTEKEIQHVRPKLSLIPAVDWITPGDSGIKVDSPRTTQNQIQSLKFDDSEVKSSERQSKMIPEPERSTNKSPKKLDSFVLESSPDSIRTATTNKQRDRKQRHQRSGPKKYLFSGTSEDLSNEGSDQSWVPNSQMKSTQKIRNYARIKKEKNTPLRVLPFLFESSENEEETKAVTGRRRRKITIEKQRMTWPGPKLWDQSDLQSSVSAVKPRNTKSIKMEAALASIPTPPSTQKGNSSSAKSTKHIAENEQYLTNEYIPDKDFTAQVSTNKPSKRRYSNMNSSYTDMGEDIESPFLHLKPKRLFSLAENLQTPEGETSPLKEADESMLLNESTQSDMDEDDGIRAAFQNFTEEMRNKLKFHYREMEQHTQHIQQTTEQKVSGLLNQIHNYSRLQKLETFEKTVIQELRTFEEDDQILKNLEKDTINFWKQQSLKVSSFYESQEQRIQSLSSHRKDKRVVSKEA